MELENKMDVLEKENEDQIQSLNEDSSGKLTPQRKESVSADKISLKENLEQSAQDKIDSIILPNKKVLIDITVEQHPLGVIVVGGKNNSVKVSNLW